MNYLSYFDTKSRSEGESRKYFVILKDNAPEDLQKLVRDIHKHEFNDCLPNDWIYATIYEAFKELRHEELDNITI